MDEAVVVLGDAAVERCGKTSDFLCLVLDLVLGTEKGDASDEGEFLTLSFRRRLGTIALSR